MITSTPCDRHECSQCDGTTLVTGGYDGGLVRLRLDCDCPCHFYRREIERIRSAAAPGDEA